MDNEFDILSNEEISSYDGSSNNDYYQQAVEQQEQKNKNNHLLLLNKMFLHLSEKRNNNKALSQLNLMNIINTLVCKDNIDSNSIFSEIQFNNETIDTLQRSDDNCAILFILKDKSGNKKAYSFYTDGNVMINYTDDYNKIKELFPNLPNEIPKPKDPIKIPFKDYFKFFLILTITIINQ